MIIFFATLSIALAGTTADEKKVAERCDFAVMAARTPPALPSHLAYVCTSNDFKIIEDGQLVSVDCREYCKRKGIK